MAITPKYKSKLGGEVCINAKEILEQIRLVYPKETSQTMAVRARVHPQTVQRWTSRGCADAIAIKRLINSLADEKKISGVLLEDATPAQLKKMCQEIGWDKVINA